MLTNEKTIVILGTARGGTSAIASILISAGLFFGYQFKEAGNFEDIDFVGKSLDEMRVKIEERNKQFDIWGWKDPFLVNRLEIIHEIRNPRLIFVFRDPIAAFDSVTNRDKVKYVPKSFIRSRLVIYQKILDFISESSYPFLLLSFERLIRNPKREVEKMLAFLDIDESRVEKALVGFNRKRLVDFDNGKYKLSDYISNGAG